MALDQYGETGPARAAPGGPQAADRAVAGRAAARPGRRCGGDAPDELLVQPGRAEADGQGRGGPGGLRRGVGRPGQPGGADRLRGAAQAVQRPADVGQPVRGRVRASTACSGSAFIAARARAARSSPTRRTRTGRCTTWSPSCKREWDFEQDQWKPVQGDAGEEALLPALAQRRGVRGGGRGAAARRVDPAAEVQAGRGRDATTCAINRVGATQFGTPPWARTLRFYSGLNRLTEARIAMAQAAAAFIAKRVTKGGPAQVQKAAQSVLRQAGDLSATLRAGGRPGACSRRRGPASIFNENEAHSLQPLSLNSGGAGARRPTRRSCARRWRRRRASASTTWATRATRTWRRRRRWSFRR